MKVDGRPCGVAEKSGVYSPELATVYAKEAVALCDTVERKIYKEKSDKLKEQKLDLQVLASKSTIF